MKNLAPIVFLLITATFNSYCQEPVLSKKDVPKVVQESFKANILKFKSPEWIKTDTNYQVTFFKDSKWCQAVFSPIGLWLMTKIPIAYEKLPETVKSEFERSKYNNWELGQVFIVMNPDGLELYEIQVISIDGIIEPLSFKVAAAEIEETIEEEKETIDE